MVLAHGSSRVIGYVENMTMTMYPESPLINYHNIACFQSLSRYLCVYVFNRSNTPIRYKRPKVYSGDVVESILEDTSIPAGRGCCIVFEEILSLWPCHWADIDAELVFAQSDGREVFVRVRQNLHFFQAGDITVSSPHGPELIEARKVKGAFWNRSGKVDLFVKFAMEEP